MTFDKEKFFFSHFEIEKKKFTNHKVTIYDGLSQYKNIIKITYPY